MEFNVNRCKILHTGIDNDRVHYIMNSKQLSAVDKDLGVIISSDLKHSQFFEIVETAA